jgi:trehalose synthase
MIKIVDVDEGFMLDDYESIAMLTAAVRELRVEAAVLLPQLRKRKVWMINSTAQGGGVAEMLPKMISLLREIGLPVGWAVIGSDRSRFFTVTKQLHNLIHGSGDPRLSAADREVYEAVNRENADELKAHLSPDDILVVHDPQPLALGAMLKREMGLRTIWRCHIGLDEHTPQTRAAWGFLRPYAEAYDHAVFSAPEYIPDYLTGHSKVIHPAIDPCSHKNRALSPHKLVGILCNSGLKQESQPVLTPPFDEPARRLGPSGEFQPASGLEQIGLLYRPVVTQISRWDRLKGYRPLLDGFVRLKQRLEKSNGYDPRHRHRLEIVRLVLAGPDPAWIEDDPEGREVLEELCTAYRKLSDRFQADVALLTLPMDSRKENALMVNALQRCSTVVVQNSVREGFGLTATEAMWKQVPVMGTHACGIRQQIRDGVDGVLIEDAEDADEIAERLDVLLADVVGRDRMSRSGQRRVQEKFLVFIQLCNWLRLLAECAGSQPRLPLE